MLAAMLDRRNGNRVDQFTQLDGNGYLGARFPKMDKVYEKHTHNTKGLPSF
jgi:hypothetical protein